MKNFLILIGKSLLIMILSVAFLAIATRIFPPPQNHPNGTGMVVGVLMIIGLTSLLYIVISAIWRSKESFFFKIILITNLLIALFSMFSVSQ
ncbi:hypothetical protein JMN32_24320 [Fulvivirga sp. 29W222]|uniref:Uncharacterized protein n=1 Tax=Fulvivirga marina TaxID=2494733 RepID=A0A937G3S4_9BACT|nr:hypothetical protein [Fulvivirga marina]MBL6449460.1 hypothetical protein [Fulvivirga marina]